MPCPHYEIKIISRGNKQSAVAAAAYQAGDRLFCERDHRTKNYSSKKEVVYTEILLPTHAPPEYADRNRLWNSVEAVEPNWNSQLARRFIIALPRELPIEDSIRLIRKYCEREFVSKGMIADIGVHNPDPPGYNPHAHVMLTMRPFDENGKWMEKSRKVYDLDKDGNRIRGKNGRWKFHKVFTTDWDDRENAERWRQAWEVLQNEFLENAERSERVSMKSLERQGIDRIPEAHMGPAVAAMERLGIRTDVGELNREIRKTNGLIASVEKVIRTLKEWISSVKEALAEVELEPTIVTIPTLVSWIFDVRKNDRYLNWDNKYAIQKADKKDSARATSISAYLHGYKIRTLTDLDNHMTETQNAARLLKNEQKQIENRMKTITRIKESMDRYRELKPIHDEYLTIHWKSQQQKFSEEHKAELDEWKKCEWFLRKNLPDQKYHPRALAEEYKELKIRTDDLNRGLIPLQYEINMMKDVKWLIKGYLPLLTPESEDLSLERKEEKRESILKKLDEAKKQTASSGGSQGRRSDLKPGKQHNLER